MDRKKCVGTGGKEQEMDEKTRRIDSFRQSDMLGERNSIATARRYFHVRRQSTGLSR